MAVKYFGQFLLDKRIVTREDLLRAITLQEQKNLKLGELSVAIGCITQLQGRTNLKLGELATAMNTFVRATIGNALDTPFLSEMKLGEMLNEMSILARNQLNEVVSRQKKTHLYIGQSLVQVGAISTEQLYQYLEEYKADQARYASGHIEIPVVITNRATWEMTADLTYKMISDIIQLPITPGKCQAISEASTNFMMAAMDLTGDVEARYIISVSERLQRVVAKAILDKETIDCESAEVLEDTVMEFVNVVCGNVAAKCSQMGKVVNISPPVAIRSNACGMPIPPGQIGLCFPIDVGESEKMELILIIKS